MTLQPAFDFDAPQYAPRKQKQELAYDRNSDEWREAVYNFAVGVFLVDRAEHFIFEELTRAYESYAEMYDKPKTVEKRAYAGVQQRLRKEKSIEVVPDEFGRSYEGNLRPMYRSNLR